jgi:hypothetical protein
VGVGVVVGVGEVVGVGVVVGVGEVVGVGVAVGVDDVSAEITLLPLLQINFFPDLMQV